MGDRDGRVRVKLPRLLLGRRCLGRLGREVCQAPRRRLRRRHRSGKGRWRRGGGGGHHRRRPLLRLGRRPNVARPHGRCGDDVLTLPPVAREVHTREYARGLRGRFEPECELHLEWPRDLLAERVDEDANFPAPRRAVGAPIKTLPALRRDQLRGEFHVGERRRDHTIRPRGERRRLHDDLQVLRLREPPPLDADIERHLVPDAHLLLQTLPRAH